MHFLKYVLAAAVSVMPLIASATSEKSSFEEIKRNAAQTRQSDTRSTNGLPPNQVASAPAISWVPKLNLDNARGTPAINLRQARGQIRNTSGVSQDIQAFVKNEVAKASNLGSTTTIYNYKRPTPIYEKGGMNR